MNINKRKYGMWPLDNTDAPKTTDELIYAYARMFVDSLYTDLELKEEDLTKETQQAIRDAVGKYFQ